MSMSAADWTRMQRRKAGNTYVLDATKARVEKLRVDFDGSDDSPKAPTSREKIGDSNNDADSAEGDDDLPF
jgi:hypothetical protein